MMPVDTVKTRLQFQGTLKNVRSYHGTRNALVSILREEGLFRGFYRGLPAKLAYTAPAAAVSFTVYEQVKQSLAGENGRHPAIPLTFGLAMRMLGTAARTPFDIVKQRLQIDGALAKSKYTGTLPAFRALVSRHRTAQSGLLTGYSITLMRDLPFAGIYFTTYEMLKSTQLRLLHEWVRADSNDDSALSAQEHVGGRIVHASSPDATDPASLPAANLLQPYHHLIAGAGAGALASGLTIPFDVVKTRLQTQGSLEHVRYTGPRHAVATIWREEGMAGFLRGLGPRLLYIIPASSLTFTAYEQYKRLLDVA